MALTFQGWRFQCWRQALLWTAKKIRRQRIRGITRRRSESNARGELAESLGVTQQVVSARLRAMGIIKKQGNWVPYELEPRDIERRFYTCEQLIQRQQRKDFLHRIVTGYEKWIFYDHPKKKKYYAKPGQPLPSTSTLTPKPNIHGSKIMLCIWYEKGCCLLWAAETWRFWAIGIGYNWFVWAVHCDKNGRNTAKTW